MKLTFIQRDLWLKIMKATSIVCILATVLLSTAYAHGVSGQQVLNQRLSLNVKNESLPQVLKRIQQLVDVNFSYKNTGHDRRRKLLRCRFATAS